MHGDGTIKTIPKAELVAAMKQYGEPMNAKEMAGIMDAVRRNQSENDSRRQEINIESLVGKVLLL